jgi:hypothetical protein
MVLWELQQILFGKREGVGDIGDGMWPVTERHGNCRPFGSGHKAIGLSFGLVSQRCGWTRVPP